jgi:hypothetical protein
VRSAAFQKTKALRRHSRSSGISDGVTRSVQRTDVCAACHRAKAGGYGGRTAFKRSLRGILSAAACTKPSKQHGVGNEIVRRLLDSF